MVDALAPELRDVARTPRSTPTVRCRFGAVAHHVRFADGRFQHAGHQQFWHVDCDWHGDSPSPASIRSARSWLQHWQTGSVRLHRQTDTTHITISPSLSTSTSAPNATISALPSSGTAITFVGLASTGYAQSLVYHKDAFALACADLIMPQACTSPGARIRTGSASAWFASTTSTTICCPCGLTCCMAGKPSVRNGPAASRRNQPAERGLAFAPIIRETHWLLTM